MSIIELFTNAPLFGRVKIRVICSYDSLKRPTIFEILYSHPSSYVYTKKTLIINQKPFLFYVQVTSKMMINTKIVISLVLVGLFSLCKAYTAHYDVLEGHRSIAILSTLVVCLRF